MRLAKIKNRYLYNGDNPNGTLTYAVYYDRQSKSYRAVGLTHLYKKDDDGFYELGRGWLMKEHFRNFETSSGVKNSYYSKNIYGRKIDLNDRRNVVRVSRNHLPKSQSDRIKAFARHNNNGR